MGRKEMKLRKVSLMNIFMCLSVVLIHITSYPAEQFEKDSIWFLVFFTINRMLRFAVPCLVFLSGYKLYNRYKDEKVDIKRFYLGRVKKVVVPYIICYVIFFAYFYAKGWIEKNTFFKGLVLRRFSSTFLLYYFFNSAIFTFPTIIKNI